jgi:hypothetical protein
MISIDDLDLDFEIQVEAPPIYGWTATKRIFPIMTTTCECGQVYSAPCPPRVRERHKNGTVRESINHPRIVDHTLPAQIEPYGVHISACPQCQNLGDPS